MTSNKAVVEEYGRELTETAQQNGVFYLYEAAVGGGIPLISTLHGSFGANGIRRIAGILNGTTNYILTRLLDDGMAFDDALRLAQEKGYAEKAPTADVDGLDTARKICILASIASGKSIRLRDCRAIEGIRGILPAHVEAALLHGFSIKLLGVYENGTVHSAVSGSAGQPAERDERRVQRRLHHRHVRSARWCSTAAAQARGRQLFGHCLRRH